jgi:7-cyano-7-deazaguanine synthase
MVVLSGGQDSTTCLFWAKAHFDEVHAVTFDYGQKHSIEVKAAQTIASMANIGTHEIIWVPGLLQSTSPLIDPLAQLETYKDFASMDETIGDRVELTFVPLRNLFFLVLAANRAVALGISDLVIGVCQADGTNYPDCRQSFIDCAADTINQALGRDKLDSGPSFWISAPLMDLSKADSIRLAKTLPGCMEALAYSHTAYDGKYPPVGQDHASVLRAHGFEQAGEPDPLVLRAWAEGLMDLPATANYDSLRQ